MNVFVWGNQKTTDRDLGKLKDAGFGWQKTLFSGGFIEPQKKGQFDWDEADRIVKASKANGIKILARLDQQPAWARADHTAKNALLTTCRITQTSSRLRDALLQHVVGRPGGRDPDLE